MFILGISAYYHDSAAAILNDGKIVAAAQEERFTRIKADARFPHHAIAFCLSEAGITEEEIDHIIFYEDPRVKFDRLLTSYHLTAPMGWKSFISAMPSWLTEKLWIGQNIAKEMGVRKHIQFCDHHLSHAASAFYPSPFDEAAILTIDGVGEWSSTTLGVGKGSQIELLKQIRFPNSLGLLYSAFTYYTGFKINSGEYKLMGLAPYGVPKFREIIKENLIFIDDNGAIALNQKYFNYVNGLTMTNQKFHDLFGQPPRKQESQITQFEMDIAASIQDVVNEIIMKMAMYAHLQTKMDKLVLAGGVALNCVASGKVSSFGPFEELWVQPAAGDAGGALGAALWLWYQLSGEKRIASENDSMEGSFWGPDIAPSSEVDDELLRRMGGVWEDLSEEVLMARVADSIAKNKVIGVARGRMEWGPRALGARSILGDARSVTMQSHMNLKIKFRESFRPFAPMVLEEDTEEYFDTKQNSPYMLLVYDVLEKRRKKVNDDDLFGIEKLKQQRSEIPAVTHVDFSARLQTIDKKRNPFIHGVINHFKEKTGCPVIINTSFNVRSEPIVCTAEDAYRCFLATDMDCLVLGNRFLERDKQEHPPLNEAERQLWLERFERD